MHGEGKGIGGLDAWPKRRKRVQWVSWEIVGEARFQITRGNIRKHVAWAQQDHETDAK